MRYSPSSTSHTNTEFPSGDSLTENAFDVLNDEITQNKFLRNIISDKKLNKIDLGVIETDSNGFLTSYTEKPEKEYKVSMGIYVYEPAVLKYIEPNTYLDFPHLVLRLLESGEKVASYPCDDFWLDIGNQEDYAKAQREFEQAKGKFLPKEVD